MPHLVRHRSCGAAALLSLTTALFACQPRRPAPTPVEGDAGVAVRRAAPCGPGDSVEACRRACSAGLDKSCEQLGLALVAAGNHDDAKPHLEAACKNGSAAACGGLAQIDAARGQPAHARTHWELACGLGDGKSCESLAIQFMNARSASEDGDGPTPKTIVTHFKQGCELGAASSCNRLAEAIAGGLLPGEPADALRYYFQACIREVPVVSACSAAADLLAADTPAARKLRRRFNGDRMAADLLTRGCDLGDRDCCARLAPMAQQ